MWITPNNSTCRSKGGKISKGACEASWQQGKAICHASSGRLPSVHELINVVSECGGNKENTQNAWTENEENPYYQECYKRIGFIRYNMYNNYWSSTKDADKSINALGVYFPYGAQFSYDKSDRKYVRCVRTGQ